MEKYPGWLNVNDTYKIKKDFAELKEIIEEIEKDINAFLGHKKTKYKGKRARKKLALLKNELIPQISRKILKTKQDYESDYSQSPFFCIFVLMKAKKELKSILVDKEIYEDFKKVANRNGFKVKELVEKLMIIFKENNI